MSDIISSSSDLLLRGYALVLVLAVSVAGTCVSPQETPSPIGSAQPTLSPTTLSSPTKPPPPQDWPDRWLKGIPCRPPCWEGITPGQTTAEEAVEILQRSPLIASVELGADPRLPHQEGLLVEWTWAGTGEAGGWAASRRQMSSNAIYAIHPYYYVSFRLGDVIQAYGEPTHVIALSLHDHDDYSIVYHAFSILYLSQGFAFRNVGARSKPMIGVDTRLEEMFFFVPGDEGIRMAWPFPLDGTPEMLVPWQGMQDFDFYCRDKEGKPCSQQPASR